MTPLINELAHDAYRLPFQDRFHDLDMTLVAVDGTLIKALPKMLWALWMDEDRRAAKMHLEFDILKGIPLEARVTDANTSEIAQLESLLSPGKLYCLDAGYRKYHFLNTILQQSSSFIVRLHNNASYELIQERALSETDRKAGIEFDRVVWLGSTSTHNKLSRPVRIIQLRYHDERTPSGLPRTTRPSSKKTCRTPSVRKTLLIVTDRMDLPAELIMLMYRYRWQIELFFRWFKCVLGCKHLLAHSENGVTLQVYCALIASLLIRLWTGRKPTKRTFEMICLYFQGWATLEELIEHIEQLKSKEQKQP
ncbi:MAG: IS4 family transposase [Candidatus Jettenia sp.]|uniref:Transposase n=1 Tax=Candidatus Jettenia caeni TaxID=247490 RepID=I3IMF9_9BACT|nr:MAG: IS4 family transposase [Candidatus Jettenia sp. AMX1]MBC6930101.1 IS4 family transposase [Candidatus Jettenia sp.]WKZ14662.1 MAG: IS4 family transposase [Candidatus Jettenia caeni]MCE7881816.1 IS4 family transposase [Candidatus Jettenia sp. AMX1]MCQ3928400.1 IS4 family transposase [Candidatus Jettenia sp.]